jgi:hypothetical protein
MYPTFVKWIESTSLQPYLYGNLATLFINAIQITLSSDVGFSVFDFHDMVSKLS